MAINLKMPELKKRKKSDDGAEKAKKPKEKSGGLLSRPIGRSAKAGKSGNKKLKGKIPTKNYINVMIRSKKEFNLRKHLPIIILIAVLLLAFCKFMVFDRLAAVIIETNKVSSLQEQLVEVNSQIDELSEYDDMYAHYTTSGMTEEELSLVDRVAAMRLVGEAFRGGNISRSWNLTGNVMTLQVSGPSLNELNDLASELELDPIVERCVISSADKRTDANGNVIVTFTVYLHKAGAGE